MKNMEASVGAVPTQEKKEVEGEDEYTEHRNEMYFFLQERPEYRIYATGRWQENQEGKVVGDADTYFHHILTCERCETAWTACVGWYNHDERIQELWETLSMRIQNTDGLEQIICDEKSFGV